MGLKIVSGMPHSFTVDMLHISCRPDRAATWLSMQNAEQSAMFCRLDEAA